VEQALDLVRLRDFPGRYPDQLSGGQQQRVSLARALVIQPHLLLLDEPLSNLDARLRDEMRTEIRDLHRRLGVTTVLVTHDIEEAFVMSDRIAVLRAGRVEQIGAPSELYRRPVNRFVASFVGAANEFEIVTVEADGARLHVRTRGNLVVAVSAAAGLTVGAAAGGGARWLVVRPESVRISVASGETDNRYDARVDDLIYLGGVTRCRLRVGDAVLTAAVPSALAGRLRPGDVVPVGWNVDDCAVSRAD
jgi:putative spermidine/putrescine transport system ATP-binding protein